MLFFVLAMICLLWMHFVVRGTNRRAGIDPIREP
jgi:hypothetical protein